MAYDYATRLPYIGSRMREVFPNKGAYSRDGHSVTIDATPGHTDYQALTPTVAVTAITYVDFIITAADLIIPTIGLTVPKAGDRFTWKGRNFTVTSPTDTDDCFQYTTQLRDRLRVHMVER